MKKVDIRFTSKTNSNSRVIESISEGVVDNETVATGEFSHAEGYKTQALGKYSHAEGRQSIANNESSHAEGHATKAEANWTHAEGYASRATGIISHASGYFTVADKLQFVLGKSNIKMPGGELNTREGTAFIIGNGTNQNSGNAFRIDYDGEVYASNSYNSTGTGYSEMYEWSDGNINDEDRRGLFVTLENDKIRIANGDDNYILGVVSSNSALICDTSSEEWAYKYEKDVFGSVITEIVESENLEDENGIFLNQENKSEKMILNDLYNEKLNYVQRNQRSEWATICLLGKVVVIDDGTCEVNSYCKSNENGIATKSDTGYRVVERIDENHIKIILK